MNPVRSEVREMSRYLEHGEVKEMAQRFGIKHQRAKDLVSGRLRVTDADRPFIMALYDLAAPRKRELDKLKVFTRNEAA